MHLVSKVWYFFIENWTVFLFLRAVVNIPIQTRDFATTFIYQDDNLTAGAWAACRYI